MENGIDWDAFADTPAALEREHIEGGEPWANAAAAGLQFYAYGRSNGLGGRVLPQSGDRLTLSRQPDNGHDRNAVELLWRNRHQLGHLPRGVAATLAPRLDRGEACRAYVWHEGTGAAWSLRVFLVGAATAVEHAERQEVEREAAELREIRRAGHQRARERATAEGRTIPAWLS